MRKTILLREMLIDVATPTQIQRYDYLVDKNKGSATHYALRVIKRHWDRLLHKPYTYIQPKIEPRTIKVNQNGKSSFVKLERVVFQG